MKTIAPISIWDNGTVQQATIINTYAEKVLLNSSATFCYALFNIINGSVSNLLIQGKVTMSGEAYKQWQEDSYAWEYVATQLNLTITGDYVPPVVEPIVEVTAQVDAESEPKVDLDNNLE